jgi:hypothetical protein
LEPVEYDASERIDISPAASDEQVTEAESAGTQDVNEEGQELEEWSARVFGTHLHGWYAREGELRFAGENGDEVYAEKPVQVLDQDGTEHDGFVDLVVHEKYLFDFKSDDMRSWNETSARERAEKYGKQMQQYMESPDTPEDASGWIIATTPSESDEVTKAFEETLDQYGVKVRYSKGVEAQSVLDEVESVLEGEQSEDEEESS